MSGIAFAKDEAKITVIRVPDRPGVAAGDLRPAGRRQHQRRHDRAERVARRQLDRHHLHRAARRPRARASSVLEKAKATSSSPTCMADTNVAKVSVIGVGMRSHAGVALKMFETLAAKGINIQVISTSEIKISVLIAAEYTELAVRALHTAYELDAA